jgi:D-glycero-D-manno-heptose 1,7-bisphosphate phosphatase
VKAAFLDRDGVINEDFGYVGKIENFKFKEGIFELLKLLQELGYALFIVTNQSGIARSYYSEEDFYKLTEWMKNELKKRGIEIKDVEFCPHHPDFTGECECRKPKPGMILNLAEKYKIDLKNSIMIGDKKSDMEAAKRAGICKTYLVEDSLHKIIDEIQFDVWNDLKKNLNKRDLKNFKFYKRDVFFMHLGKNVGFEQFGKGLEFLRPVVVLKKISKHLFLGVPLSSKKKEGFYYFEFNFKGKKNYALFNQIRIFDIRRNKYFAGRVSSNTFEKLEKFLLKRLTPKRENDP